MKRLLLFVAVAGCGPGSEVPPVFVTDTGEAMDTGGPPGPLEETRLRVGAVFRVDAATGLPGPWLDESSGARTSAIEIIVGDDQYNGSSGTWCVVSVPISAEGATRREHRPPEFRQPGDLQEGQFWGVDLVVDQNDISTNCDQPRFERIWDFYGGELVEYVTLNLDGSPASWAIILERPTSDAVGWLTGGGNNIEETEVIGGEIQLSNRWPSSRINAIATLGERTDPDGVLLIDEKGENQPIPLLELYGGAPEGRYRLIGYQYYQVTTRP